MMYEVQSTKYNVKWESPQFWHPEPCEGSTPFDNGRCLGFARHAKVGVWPNADR